MHLRQILERSVRMVKRHKLLCVLTLFASGLFLLSSGFKNEPACSGRWSRSGCDGTITTYWDVSPILITIGGVLLLAAFLLYRSQDNA